MQYTGDVYAFEEGEDIPVGFRCIGWRYLYGECAEPKKVFLCLKE
jgi:hypothetical protein